MTLSRNRSLLAVALPSALALAACQDPTSSTVADTRLPGGVSRNQIAAPGAALAANPLGTPRLPGRIVDQMDPNALVGGADATAAACQSSTPVTDWYVAQVRKVIAAEPATYALLRSLDAANVPTYEAWVIESNATPQYYGYTGEFTHVLTKTEKDVKRFWDIPSASIQMVPMHGSVLLNVPKIAGTYQIAYGIPDPAATQYATLLRNAVAGSTTLNGGNHPYFTFNSVAVEAIPELGLPAKVIMGDGVLEGYAAVGLGDVAPQGVFAHEFGHQVQFARNYFNDPYATTGTPAQQTRYTELMADALSAYYLTHSRGASMNRKRVEQFLQVFFQIGDCALTSPGHHGTPTERLAAARFGFSVADEAQKQGHILTADQFHARFVAAYPTLLDQ